MSDDPSEADDPAVTIEPEDEVTEIPDSPEKSGDALSFGVAVLLLVAMVAFAWQGTHDDKSWTSMVSEIQAFLGDEAEED